MSCETQLVEAIQDWTEVLNRSGQTDVLLLDFSKAFDKVTPSKISCQTTPLRNTGEDSKLDRRVFSQPTVVCGSQRIPLIMETSEIGCPTGVSVRANPIPAVHQ